MWPRMIEMTVFGTPEILSLSHTLSATEAIYLTASDLEVRVRRGAGGMIEPLQEQVW